MFIDTERGLGTELEIRGLFIARQDRHITFPLMVGVEMFSNEDDKRNQEHMTNHQK